MIIHFVYKCRSIVKCIIYHIPLIVLIFIYLLIFLVNVFVCLQFSDNYACDFSVLVCKFYGYNLNGSICVFGICSYLYIHILDKYKHQSSIVYSVPVYFYI